MSGLAVASLARAGVSELIIVNRTPERARRLAESSGGRTLPLAELPAALAAADVVVSCTGAVGHVVGLEDVRAALVARGERPQIYVDLAMPRDIDPAVDGMAAASVIDLESLGRHLATHPVGVELAHVREMVTAEVADYLSGQRAEAVAPTVVALRALASSVVESELSRLQSRLGPVDDRVRAEVRQTVHRVVEKLLHTPTVRVKELAAEPGGSLYAEALRQLFGLGPDRVVAMSSVPAEVGNGCGELPSTVGLIAQTRGGAA
jgi:glutamyl-tRNA reductase